MVSSQNILKDFASTSPLWQTYTSEEAWLPLILPFAFWTSIWIHRTYICQQSFAKFYNLHGFHHIVAITMGLTSMYVNDDSIFNERIVILWSSGYFFIDILDCLVITKDYPFLFHGIMCFVLGLLNYNVPLLRTLRMNSKATLIETSTFVLHEAKRTKDPLTFLIFAILFTMCRIVWIPLMMKELYEHDSHWIILGLLLGFYALQVFWWIKIIKIIIQGRKGGGSSSDIDEKKKNGDESTMTTDNNKKQE
jgi:hypothetical protein